MPPLEPVENQELMAALRADPDDEHAWLVYGDWLQARGDPRGELLALQSAMRRETDTGRFAALKKEQDALLAAHHAHFFSGLAGHLDQVKVTWRNGFFHTAHIGGKKPGTAARRPDAVKALLESPSARVLQELTIDATTPQDLDYQLVVDAVTMSCPPTLRFLSLAENAGRMKCGDLTRLLPKLVQLRRLHLGGDVQLGALVFPELRRFAMSSNPDAEVAMAEAIANATWPKLERLWIDGMLTAEVLCALAPLFAGHGVPALTSLVLNGRDANPIVRAWLASALLPQLTEFQSTVGDVDAETARAVIGQKARLTHLKKLHFAAVRLNDQEFTELRSVCTGLNAYQVPART